MSYRGNLPKLSRRGYYTVTGPNNSGKTNLLYGLFAEGVAKIDQRIFVPHVREGSVVTTSYGNWDLTKINRELSDSFIFKERETRGNILPFYLEQLTRALFTRGDPQELKTELERCLKTLGFGPLTNVGVHNDNDSTPAMLIRDGHGKEPIYTVGGGYNSIILVLQAALNPHVKEVYIDEPEIGLEAEKQKLLRDILIAHAENKRIVVVTHSHLLLDKNRPTANYQMMDEQGKGSFTAVPCADRADVGEVIYELLGNSLEDLMLPQNYIVVEGASDARIVDRIIELQGRDREKVFCLYAKGIGNISKRVAGVYNIIWPLQVPLNPYAEKVVCVIDKPKASEQTMCDELVARLTVDRCKILSEHSLERYIPEKLYTKAGMVKSEQLRDLTTTRDSREIKERISNAIAAVMDVTDIGLLPEFRDAVEQAYKSL